MTEPSCWELVRSGAAPDPNTFASRSATFGSAVRHAGRSCLVVVHEPGRGTRSFVVCPPGTPHPERVAGNAASALGAKAERTEAPELASSDIVHMVARPSETAARETQAGSDPYQVASHLAASLPEGCWAAVSLREPSRREVSSVRKWYDFRLGSTATHHARSGEVLACSLWAGGPDRGQVAATLEGMVAAMPGFDIEATAQRPPGHGLGIAALVLAGLAAWFGTRGTAPFWDGWAGVPQVTDTHRYAFIGLLALALVLMLTGIIASPLQRARRSVGNRVPPVPPRRTTPPRRPRKEFTDQQGRTRREFMGDYPLALSSFLVGPSVVLGMASPHSGQETEAASTRMRQVPAALRQQVGPVIGTADGTPVHISQVDRFAGVALFGLPGSGKSVVIGNLFGYDTWCRANGAAGRPQVVPGDTGVRNTMVAFENKGRDGVDNYMRWGRAFGDSIGLVEVADPTSPAIDMFGPPGPAAVRADFMVDSMVYAFGEQAIGHRSQNTLRQVLPIGLLLTAEDIEFANRELTREQQPLLPPSLSPMAAADVLLGSRGDLSGVSLASAVAVRASNHPGGELSEAVARLTALYGKGVSQSTRRSLQEAPQSKVAKLLGNPSWWHPARRQVGWDDIISGHWSVVINAGQSTTGQQVGSELTQVLLSMLTFGLQKAIERNCADWGSTGRSISVFSDELSLLAGSGNSDVFEWLRNQGRSFGVRPAFATQLPEQLEDRLRKTVLGFGTFLWLAQNDPGVASIAVADLTADGSDWSVADIVGLEPYHGVLRTIVDKQRQPSVPVRTAFYGGHRIGEFAREQGLDED